MAIIEIARIQVRRGQENQTGVPQLAGGEFGWAADTEKLYIGLSRDDGGARDANVEILTENHLRNFFNALSPLSSTASYVYRVGTLITAEDNINEFQRTIQDRLDEGAVSIENFGAVANGGDDTAILQYAIDNLFLNAASLPDNPARVLILPPGTIRISETVHIPKNTHIVGQGPGKTKILITSTGSHAFQTVDSTSVGGNSFVKFPTINSNTKPDDVSIENLTIEISSAVPNNQTLSLISLDCSDNPVIKNVKFKGSYTAGATTSTNNVAIDIRGLGAVTSKNILIDNCQFDGLYYGIKSNYDILNPLIINCKFNNLNKGIVFNNPIELTANIGPRFARIMYNRFENIEEQAILGGSNFSTTSTNHISMYNQYINVGNGIIWNELSTTGTSVIKYATEENLSIHDYFNRYEVQYANSGAARKFNKLVEGNLDIVLANNRSVAIPFETTRCITRIPILDTEQFIVVKYNASSATPVSRSGTLEINIGSTSNPETSLTDNYNYVSPTEGELVWSLVKDTVNKWIELRATNNNSNLLTIEHKTTLMV